jgi:hypothetical protein
MKDWNEGTPPDERRRVEDHMREVAKRALQRSGEARQESKQHRLEKNALFAHRYGTRGKTLKQLAEIKPLGRWGRLMKRIFGVRCLTCGVKIDDKYWQERYPNGAAFEHLVRLICEDRRCFECALAEEKLEREREASQGA